MYHYILLFINKVLYYIRIPFLHIENPFCDFVIVIVWLGIKAPPYSLPQPLRREGSASSQVFCRKLSDKEPSPYPSCAHRHSPPFGGVGGGCRSFSIFTYLSVKQIVTRVFAELVTPVPQKTIAFWIKLLTFANREQKAPPDLPEPTVTDRREVKEEETSLQVFCRKLSEKRVKSPYPLMCA